MNANELLFFLKGYFSLVNEAPTSDMWGIIRAAVLEAHPAGPPEMRNPRPGKPPFVQGGCGCKQCE